MDQIWVQNGPQMIPNGGGGLPNGPKMGPIMDPKTRSHGHSGVRLNNEATVLGCTRLQSICAPRLQTLQSCNPAFIAILQSLQSYNHSNHRNPAIIAILHSCNHYNSAILQSCNPVIIAILQSCSHYNPAIMQSGVGRSFVSLNVYMIHCLFTNYLFTKLLVNRIRGYVCLRNCSFTKWLPNH